MLQGYKSNINSDIFFLLSVWLNLNLLLMYFLVFNNNNNNNKLVV